MGKEDQIERVQSLFIKKILHLNPLTPGYLLRLETGRLPLGLNTLKNNIQFWIRCLNLDDSRITKQAFNALLNMKSGNSEKNWCFQLRDQICSLGFPFVWEKQDPILIKKLLPQILESFINNSIQRDYTSIENSTRYAHYKLYKTNITPERYLNNPNTPLYFVRIFSQLRLNLDTIRVKDKIIKLKSTEEPNCQLCNTPNDIRHILIDCSTYTSLRSKLLRTLTPSNLHIFLNDDRNLYKLVYFISKTIAHTSVLN